MFAITAPINIIVFCQYEHTTNRDPGSRIPGSRDPGISDRFSIPKSRDYEIMIRK